MKTTRFGHAILLAALTLSLLSGQVQAQTFPKNILFVLADDIGTDSLALFNTNTVGTSFAPTPNLMRWRGKASCSGTPMAIPPVHRHGLAS